MRAPGERHAPLRPLRTTLVTLVVAGVLASLAVVTPASAAPGDLLWSSPYSGSPYRFREIEGSTVSPDGATVFVTGYISHEYYDHEHDYLTVAYSADSGAQLWAKPYDQSSHYDEARAIAVGPSGNRVFVTGESDGHGTRSFSTIAYRADTGARLWTKLWAEPGASAGATAIAVGASGKQVFVEGNVYRYDSTTGSFTERYATVAYRTSTGAKLWTKLWWTKSYKEQGQAQALAAIAVSPSGKRVFVAGRSGSSGTGHGWNYATIAYRATNGAELWTRRYDGPASGNDVPSAIAAGGASGGTVFVTGTSEGHAGSDYATIAYRADTGAKLWTRRYDDPASASDVATAIVLSPRRKQVFVTGRSRGSGTAWDYATVAYGSDSGTNIWTARYDDGSGGADEANAIAVSPDGASVFVTGYPATVVYAADTGASRWSVGDCCLVSKSFVSVSPDGTTIYVAGWKSVEAYDA
jgi:hypothetical protein